MLSRDRIMSVASKEENLCPKRMSFMHTLLKPRQMPSILTIKTISLVVIACDSIFPVVVLIAYLRYLTDIN